MRILIDTHILLWWLMGDLALPPQAKSLVAKPGNAVYVSAVTMWEIWLKVSLGKLRLPPDFETRLSVQPFETLPATSVHARGVANLPWHHRDPFDRMLIAQAITEGLIFLTADEHCRAYGEFVHVAGGSVSMAQSP